MKAETPYMSGARQATSFILIALALVMVAGCGSSSFVSQRYDNFTAYYNKFYNAERSFKEANKRQTAVRPIDRELIMTVFPVASRAGSTRDYENAIRKSADVLRGHENSKWVDDALMLIGRAYFNQQNYVSAEQKFREVMALDTKLRDEARYWLARSQIAGNQYATAEANLEDALSGDEVSRKWRPFLQLAVGELHVRQGNFADAAAPLTEGLKVKDRRLAGRAQFLLGQVYEKLGDYDTAVEMYQRVRKHKPPYELSFAAQVRAIEVGAEYGDREQAERALRKMERDDKNFENRGDLSVVRSKLMASAGEPGAAIGALLSMLRDDESARPEVRGAAHYTIATLYRDVFRDYGRAAVHFDTAATSLQGQILQRRTFGLEQSIVDPFAPGAIEDVLEEKAVFMSFLSVTNEVGRMDSLLTLGTMEESAFRERLEEIRQIRIEEMKEQDRIREEADIQGQFNDSSVLNNTGLPEGKVIDNDPGAAEAGFLFHKEPVRVQQAFELFREKWGDRPLVPGWRVAANISGVSQASALVDSTVLAQITGTGEDRYANFQLDVSDIPRSRTAQDRMRAERAIVRYELANVLFLSMNRPDTAATWYQLVIDEDADQPVAARAYYALAQVYESLERPEASAAVMQEMARVFPDVDPTVIDDDAPADGRGAVVQPGTLEVAEADTAYAEAYRLWTARAYADAGRAMIDVVYQYPDAAAAPKALLAMGALAGDWARVDTLDVFAPLPLGLPDSVRRHFGWHRIDTTGYVVDYVKSVGIDSLSVEVTGTDAAGRDSTGLDVAGSDSLAADLTDGDLDGDELVEGAGAADSVAVAPTTVQSPPPVLPSRVAITDTVWQDPKVADVYTYLTSTYPLHETAREATKALNEMNQELADRAALQDSLAAASMAAAAIFARADSMLADSMFADIEAEVQASLVGAASDVPEKTRGVTAGDPTSDETGGATGEASPENTVQVLPGSATDGVPRPSAAAGAAMRDSLDADGNPVKAPAVDVPRRDTIDVRRAPTILPMDQVDVAPVLIGGEDKLIREILGQGVDDASGTVEVSFVVTPEGRVSQATVEKGLSETVDRAVLRALYQSRFQPGTKDNRIVAVRVRRSIDITIE